MFSPSHNCPRWPSSWSLHHLGRRRPTSAELPREAPCRTGPAATTLWARGDRGSSRPRLQPHGLKSTDSGLDLEGTRSCHGLSQTFPTNPLSLPLHWPARSPFLGSLSIPESFLHLPQPLLSQTWLKLGHALQLSKSVVPPSCPSGAPDWTEIHTHAPVCLHQAAARRLSWKPSASGRRQSLPRTCNFKPNFFLVWSLL